MELRNLVVIPESGLQTEHFIRAAHIMGDMFGSVKSWQIKGDMYVGLNDQRTMNLPVVASSYLPDGIGVFGLDGDGRAILAMASSEQYVFFDQPFDFERKIMKLIDDGILDSEIERIRGMKEYRDKSIAEENLSLRATAVKSSDLPPINPEHLNQLLDYQLQIEAEESAEIRNILNPKAKLDAAIDSAICEFMDTSGQKVLNIVINGDIDSSNGQYIVRLESA